MGSVAQVLDLRGDHVGMATLIDDHHLVTCAHVIRGIFGSQFHPTRRESPTVSLRWLAVPDAIQEARVLSEGWVAEDAHGRGDMAVLAISSETPSSVAPAEIIESVGREGHSFRAYGANAVSAMPVRVDGRIRGREGPGGTWIRLEPADGPEITNGYSGTAVFDATADGVLGIIVSRDSSPGSRSAFFLPVDQLVQYWRPLEKYVVSRFERSVEAREHWLPRARGVGSSADKGWYFTGRRAIIDELTAKARGESRDGYFCVTGAPGTGKSSIMARLPIISDVRLASIAAGGADDVRITDSQVVAIYLRQMSFPEVITQLANKLETSATGAEGIVDAIQRRPHSAGHLILVFDGIDEAADELARIRIARDLVRRLGNDSATLNLTVVASSRSGVPGSENESIIKALGSRCARIQADSDEYVSVDDFARFVESRIADADDSLAYGDTRVERLAERVAEASFPVYLVAQLVTRSLIADREMTQEILDRRKFPETVGEAFEEYLGRFAEDEGRLRDLLCGLSHARGAGFDVGETWLSVVQCLTGRVYTTQDLQWLLSSGAAFLVESVDGVQARRYRLYHQALVDLLRVDEALPAVYNVMVTLARNGSSDPYLGQHISGHAVEAGEISDLLLDSELVLFTEIKWLLRDASRYGEKLTASSERARLAIRSVEFELESRRTPERSAYLALAGLQYGVRSFQKPDSVDWWVPWDACWEVSTEHGVIHRGPPYCGISVAKFFDEQVVISADANGVVAILWAADHSSAFEPIEVPGVPTCISSCDLADGHFTVCVGTDVGDVFSWNSLQRKLTRLTRFQGSVTSASVRCRDFGFEVLSTSSDGTVHLHGRGPVRKIWERRSDIGDEVLASCFLSSKDTFIAIGVAAGIRVLRHEDLAPVPSLGASEIGVVFDLYSTAYEADREVTAIASTSDQFSTVGLEYGITGEAFPISPVGRPVSFYTESGHGASALTVEKNIFLGRHLGDDVSVFSGHEDDVRGMALVESQSGAELLSVSTDGTMRSWPLGRKASVLGDADVESDFRVGALSQYAREAVLISSANEILVVSADRRRFAAALPWRPTRVSFLSEDLVSVKAGSGESCLLKRVGGDWGVDFGASTQSILGGSQGIGDGDSVLAFGWEVLKPLRVGSDARHPVYGAHIIEDALDDLGTRLGWAESYPYGLDGDVNRAWVVPVGDVGALRVLLYFGSSVSLYDGFLEDSEQEDEIEWSWHQVAEFDDMIVPAAESPRICVFSNINEILIWLCDSNSIVFLDSGLAEVGRIYIGGGETLDLRVTELIGRDREFNFAVVKNPGHIVGSVALAEVLSAGSVAKG